jgi:ribosomal protein S3
MILTIQQARPSSFIGKVNSKIRKIQQEYILNFILKIQVYKQSKLMISWLTKLAAGMRAHVKL